MVMVWTDKTKIIISHRGNFYGPDEEIENHPVHVNRLIFEHSMNVEVDLWIINDNYWLGHDEPQYRIDFEWLRMRRNFLWIHCKNHEALIKMRKIKNNPLNFFWHESDDFTITSKGVLWCNVGIVDEIYKTSSLAVAVLPENIDRQQPLIWPRGFTFICTDYPEYFMNEMYV